MLRFQLHKNYAGPKGHSAFFLYQITPQILIVVFLVYY
jgi:hypothetical protein